MKIPPISNSKWLDLITSFETLELKSLAFQMLIIRTKERFKNNEINSKEAIDLLYNFCVENKGKSNLMIDINNIFGDSDITPNFIVEKPQTIDKPIEVSEDIIVTEKLANLENEVIDIPNIDTDIDFENKKSTSTLEEKEKLLQELESLNSKVEKQKKDKKKKGFFKRFFIY